MTKRLVSSFALDTDGATPLEYISALALIGGAGMFILGAFGTTIGDLGRSILAAVF